MFVAINKLYEISCDRTKIAGHMHRKWTTQLGQARFHLQQYIAYMNITFAQNKNNYFDLLVYVGWSKIWCHLPDYKIWIHSPVWHWDRYLYIHESNQWRYNLCDSATWCLVWHNWSQPQGTGSVSLCLMIMNLLAHLLIDFFDCFIYLINHLNKFDSYFWFYSFWLVT